MYQHFKGKQYKVLAIAEHTETSENLVIYQALYGEGKIYASLNPDIVSLKNTEEVENWLSKYIDIKQKNNN